MQVGFKAFIVQQYTYHLTSMYMRVVCVRVCVHACVRVRVCVCVCVCTWRHWHRIIFAGWQNSSLDYQILIWQKQIMY